MISMNKVSFVVICTVLNFGHYTHAQDVSSPVCKWNSAKSTCEKDPSKMIELLTSTDKMFGLLMRCQYTTTQSTCNNMSQNTCIWENNACRISSKKLIDQIDECFYKTSYQNEINKCKNELEIIAKNTTWITKNSVRPASSCEDTVGYFSFSQDTCELMEYALQCSSPYSTRCSYGTTDTQTYQLVSDLRYIMGISQRNLSSSLQDLENYLDIKSRNLQLYYNCSNIQSSYQCEYLTNYYSPSPRYYYSPSPRYYYSPSPRYSYSPSPRYYYIPSPRYYYSPDYYSSRHQERKRNILIVAIVLPIIFGLIFVSIVCCIIRYQKVQSRREIANTASQNVAMTAVNTNEERAGNLQTEATIEIMERLPNLEFKVQKGHEHSKAICCICLESLQEGDSSTVLPCAHWFHKQCFDEWIRTKGRNVSCPLCNNTLQNTQQSQQ